MKKTRSFIIIFLLNILLNSAFAQDVNIKWGVDIEDKLTTGYEGLIGEDESFYYLWKDDRHIYTGEIKQCVFTKVDRNHKIILETNIPLEAEKGVKMKLESFIEINHTFCLLTSYYDSKQKIKYLAATTIDKSGKMGNRVLLDIHSTKYPDGYNYKIQLVNNKTQVLITRFIGGSTLAAFRVIPEGGEKYILLNADFTVFWELESKVNDIRHLTIDELGNLYTIKINANEKKIKSPTVIKIDSKDKSNKSLALNPKNDIYEVKMLLDEEILYVAGLLSTDEGLIIGIYSAQIDIKSFAVIEEHTDLFDKPLLERMKNEIGKLDFRSRQMFSGFNMPLRDMIELIVIKDLIVRENGALQLIVELQSEEPGDRLIFQSIFVFQIKESGEIDWITRIPKRQYFSRISLPYASYFNIHNDGDLYFLYNERPENDPELVGNKLKNALQSDDIVGILILAKIDGTGELTKMKYPNSLTPKKGPHFIPSNFGLLSDNKVWITARNNKVHKYGFLTWKELEKGN